MSKVFKLIVDESNEPVILEEDEVLEDILIRLESISHRIDDIQYSLIKNNDEDSSLDLDISEIDFQSIKKYGVKLTPYYVIIKIWETPSYFKLPFYPRWKYIKFTACFNYSSMNYAFFKNALYA